MIKAWIRAMRLHTLTVSVATVLAAAALTLRYGCFKPVAVALCMVFALLAQITSNFANEYYDFKQGLDKKGRAGFRRGVTEGDITPSAMKTGTFVTLAMACAIGLCLTYYGGLWLIWAGLAIAVAAHAYSTGPYPLSHHGLGEVAVVFFFGIVPVNLTFYVCSLGWNLQVFLTSLSMGLLISNVMIVNNYRDCDDDRSVGKHTLAVLIGRRSTAAIYLLNGYAAVALMWGLWSESVAPVIASVVFLALHTLVWWRMIHSEGAALNPVLGLTAKLSLLYSLLFLLFT